MRIFLLSLLVTFSISRIAQADVHAERGDLARLLNELEQLELIIATAQVHADPDARHRFQYEWLRQDLERVRLGIREHINGPRLPPQTFIPLRGDYRP